ncbi:MAG: addiction module protein [Bacilli bacterium]
MTDESRRIYSQAMTLSPMERAELVEELLASFDFPSRIALDTEWGAEAEDRLRAFEQGEVRAIPADEVFRRVGGPTTS